MHGCKEKRKHKNYFIHTKDIKRQQVGSVEFSFFAIFCKFNKQKKLVNNKPYKLVPQFKH